MWKVMSVMGVLMMTSWTAYVMHGQGMSTEGAVIVGLLMSIVALLALLVIMHRHWRHL